MKRRIVYITILLAIVIAIFYLFFPERYHKNRVKIKKTHLELIRHEIINGCSVYVNDTINPNGIRFRFDLEYISDETAKIDFPISMQSSGKDGPINKIEQIHLLGYDQGSNKIILDSLFEGNSNPNSYYDKLESNEVVRNNIHSDCDKVLFFYKNLNEFKIVYNEKLEPTLRENLTQYTVFLLKDSIDFNAFKKLIFEIEFDDKSIIKNELLLSN